MVEFLAIFGILFEKQPHAAFYPLDQKGYTSAKSIGEDSSSERHQEIAAVDPIILDRRTAGYQIKVTDICSYYSPRDTQLYTLLASTG